GDSGGPSYIRDWDNPLSARRKLELQLVGVHSSCVKSFIAGKPQVDDWIQKIDECTDAAILPLRQDILRRIEDFPPDETYVGTFGSTPISPSARIKALVEEMPGRRALYAINIDEPLIAPADSGVGTQLEFERC